MSEQAFEGTEKEGFERRFTVINENDLKKYCKLTDLANMNRSVNVVLESVVEGRVQDGKHPFNSYVVINLDEPYIGEIIAVMKRHGHWG